MFDPERDEDHGSRRFVVRVLVIAAVSVAACAALYPSVTGFAAGPDHQIGCLAVKDGWQRDHTMSDADASAAFSAFPKSLTPEQLDDPVAVARFREQMRAAQVLPEVQRAIAAEDWAAGPGACVRESRHRLVISSIGLGVLLLGCCGFVVLIRIRRRSRVLRSL
jgi:hypothetical protein